MEFQLLDRLSFQRFAGLRHSSQIPDRTTIWTFKERLIKAGASESVFDAVNRQLAKHGYIARGGQMIDASIVHAPKQLLSRDEKAIVDEGAMPAHWKPAQRRQKDLDVKQRGAFSSSIETQRPGNMFWPQWQQGFLPESLENLALIAGKSMTLFDTAFGLADGGARRQAPKARACSPRTNQAWLLPSAQRLAVSRSD